MSTYAIGDLQGCYATLQALLAAVNFAPKTDTLWFTGDLVNRGPRSLETLRFVKALGNKAITVLGNHDLHLLAVAAASQPLKSSDTFQAVLQAADRDALLEWLIQRPLLHHDQQLDFTMTHAGIAPQWNLAKAQQLADEVETVLRSQQASDLLQHMYGNQPACWQDTLSGIRRLRCIINHFTRMRCCNAQGCLDLNFKGQLSDLPTNLFPWFNFPERAMQCNNIIFGHWAALAGNTNTPQVFALDTGCGWGKQLTALCLETGKLTQVENCD